MRVNTKQAVKLFFTNPSLEQVFKEAIGVSSAKIVLVHNHPSGDTTPSRQDILLTRKVCDYARIFEIELCDHIIIGKNGYTSLKQTNSDIFLGGRII